MIEHTFDILPLMHDPLELLDLAVNGVAMLDPSCLADDDLRQSVLGVQRDIDRLRVLHAGLVHEADRRRLWSTTGARDMADWLAGSSKTSRGDAMSRVRLGAALGASEALQAAATSGEVSAATAEALHDAIATPPAGVDSDDVAQLIDACKGADPREARDAADTWKRSFLGDTPAQAEARRAAKRSVTTKVLDDGMGQLLAILPLFDLRQVTSSISQVAGKPCAADSRTTEQRMADGLVQLCIAHAKGEVKGGREKPTILITIDADDFVGNTPHDGRTAHGDAVPAHVVRLLAEHATLQRVVTAGSHVLDVGRDTRFATDAQFRALVVRDGGCRWPGCRIPANWCDIDHLVPWEAGGRSDLDNLVMWCRHHHSQKHLPGVTVLGGIDDLRLRLPDGTVVDCSSTARVTARVTNRPSTQPSTGTGPTRPRTTAAA